MPLTSRDIPQAPRLQRVRAVVDAVAAGKRNADAIAKRTRMKRRDALLHVAAATRALGLLAREGKGYRLTRLGTELSETERDSEEERSVLVRAVRRSAVLKEWAGNLLAKRAPTIDRLVRRARKAGLGERAALQRAEAVLRWREQLLGHPRFAYGARASNPTVASIAEAVAPAVAPRPVGMLQALHLQDFKSFVDERIPLGPLTVFVGANASGKSNALDAIRFLQGIALELSIADILRGRYEGGRLLWPPIRGGIQEVARFGVHEFGVQTEWRLGGHDVRHDIGCTTTPIPLVVRERLSVSGFGQYLFDTHARTLGAGLGPQEGRSINVAARGTGGRNPAQRHSAAASLLGQVDATARVRPEVTDWSARLQDAMRKATFLSISPVAMRDYVPRQALELAADGENVSAIVRQLCEEGDEQRIVDWLSELCAPRITGIEFVETELGDVMLQLVEEDGTKISARSLSDGTLRFLGELVALLKAEPGSILLVEEIENGLHPERLHLLVQLLESITRERDIQVIVTTHSPLVMAALSEQTRDNAVLFARVAGREGTVTRRLRDLPHFDAIASKRGVDHLFATGWLERAL